MGSTLVRESDIASVGRRGRSGYTLLEVLIIAVLVAVVFMSSIALLGRERASTKVAVRASELERSAARMLLTLERELANAAGASPIANLTQAFGAGADTIHASTTAGFPPRGTLVIDRGLPNEEEVAYTRLHASQLMFLECGRGQQCTSDVAHAVNAEILWGGLAECLAQQDPPPAPDAYDGIALESLGETYFRGRGTGFCYRVPIDPDPGGEVDFLDGDELQLGAEVPGFDPTLEGWMAIYYEPREIFNEADHENDLNVDGDTVDVFDVGQLRQVVWDGSDPGAEPRDVGIGPATILQQRCGYASDLDGDGYEDPMFLWNESTNELHVRLFLISAGYEGEPMTRALDAVIFLRNEMAM